MVGVCANAPAICAGQCAGKSLFAASTPLVIAACLTGTPYKVQERLGCGCQLSLNWYHFSISNFPPPLFRVKFNSTLLLDLMEDSQAVELSRCRCRRKFTWMQGSSSYCHIFLELLVSQAIESSTLFAKMSQCY